MSGSPKQDQARVLAVKGKGGFDINAPVSEPTSIAIGWPQEVGSPAQRYGRRVQG